MCGLLGYIGTSKNPKKTEELVTALFDRTQARGIDAAGFYCVSEFEENKIYYHKQPGPSIDLIKKRVFKDLWNKKTNLGLFHCRAASAGVGLPSDNINNHPFVSEDLSKAVIHNGIVIKNELGFLKNFYQTKSTCDSEIILRILEQEDKTFINNLLFFLNYAQESHFSVAYTQNRQNERKLLLFRNKQRPLFYADLLEELGQIFFFSTEEIFLGAVGDLKNKGLNINQSKITEINPYEIFEFVYKKNCNIETYMHVFNQEDKYIDTPKDYYFINDSVSKKFESDKNSYKQNNLEEDLIDCIFELQNQQTKLLTKIASFIHYKNVDCKQYEDAVSTIIEINKKLNSLNLRL